MSDQLPDPANAPEDARLAALMAWRQRMIDSGAVAPGRLKEAHLRAVLLSKRTDADQIRAILPGSLSEHADDIARVLAETAPAAPPPPPPQAHAVPASPPPPPPPPPPPAQHQQPVQHQPPPPQPVGHTEFGPADFAVFAFGEQPTELHAITPRRPQTADGTLGPRELTWPAYELPARHAPPPAVVIYRLVSADDNPPYSPDRARLVAATTTTAARDNAPLQTAVRHYQVWVNAGESVSAALAAQPVKHAEWVHVGPVHDFALREDAGRVIGRWRVPPTVGQVFVYRMPADHVGPAAPQHRICADAANLTGFVDADVQRGQRYRYAVRAAAAVGGGLRLSDDAAEDVVLVSAVLAPITDLAVHDPPGDATFDLSWTPPPAGDVLLFRTENGPRPGTSELPASALDQVGLRPEFRLDQLVTTHRDEQGRPRAVMAGVSWPTEWSRGYLTPVTVLGGRAVLGHSHPIVRTGVIHDVDLAEYCNKQVLTFDWPEGAASVFVFKAPKGHNPIHGLTGTPFEITFEEYERYGGLHLSAGALPDRGCSLHLQPVAYSKGRRTEGRVRTVTYPGLLRLWYSVVVHRDPMQGTPTHAVITMWAREELGGSPAFVLVNNPDRLPLSRGDGDPIDVVPLDPSGNRIGEPAKELQFSALSTQPTGEAWAARLHGRHGWIRLFVNTGSADRLRTIALLDPPVDQLRLMIPGPR